MKTDNIDAELAVKITTSLIKRLRISHSLSLLALSEFYSLLFAHPVSVGVFSLAILQ